MKTWKLLAACSLLLLFSHLAHAGSITDVALGTDYFQTQAGTFFNFMGQTIPLTGNPIGPGMTDTIIERQSDAVLGGTTPIQITALSLESVAPVNIGGSFFDIFVTLDPLNLSNDTGALVITGDATGGT